MSTFQSWCNATFMHFDLWCKSVMNVLNACLCVHISMYQVLLNTQHKKDFTVLIKPSNICEILSYLPVLFLFCIATVLMYIAMFHWLKALTVSLQQLHRQSCLLHINYVVTLIHIGILKMALWFIVLNTTACLKVWKCNI